jgi:transposase
VKLSCVATDVLGVSGRLMLEALVSGTRDPELLADLARGALRKKLPALQQALAADFTAHHTLIVSQILAHIDYLDEAIATLTQEVEQRLAPFAHTAELLTTIDGVASRTAQVILAELGPDMSRFATDRHAASWTAIWPRQPRIRRKAQVGASRNGNPHLQAALIEGANAAIPTRDTYLRASMSRSNAVAGTSARSSPWPIRS